MSSQGVELTSAATQRDYRDDESDAGFGDSSDSEDDEGLLGEESVFQVIGLNCQVLNIQLQPKQKVLTEPRTFVHAR